MTRDSDGPDHVCHQDWLTSGIGDSDEDATDIVSSTDETNKLIPWMIHPLWELNRVCNVIW